ncbi:MAG TPA: SRPBCC domain-containing protein [Pyrinomonadaceae bacterium]|jgi:carbon monoxide dehydrogenase subunit G
MFTIKAVYNDKFEINTPVIKVREFFADIRNFVELMPNVESINIIGDNTARWTIRAEIPFIGAMSQSFNVELAENTDERIEWIPKTGETENFLRYAADFIANGEGKTLVQFSQMVELRRNKAKDFHFLAGLAGESRVSQGMQSEVAGMLKKFVQRTREKLER